MNRFQFILRRMVARFGLVAPRHYLRTATEESLMLKEAEVLLGKIAWRELESVEELTNEYWRIRQLDTEQVKLEAKLEEARIAMTKVQEDADAPETIFTAQLEEVQARLENERNNLATKLKSLQSIIQETEQVRKKFNGLKLKLTVLKCEDTSETELAKVRADLQSTKQTYADLARDVENLRGEIALQEEKVNGIETEEDGLRSRLSHRERNLTRNISDVSRRLIENNARMGVLESEKAELFTTIGRTLRSGAMGESEAYRNVLQKFHPIITRARNLAKSIEFNRRLADFK